MYEFECNIDKSYKDMKTDEWGAAFVWLSENIGVEYNFCIDESNNCSAIYKTEMNDEGYMETDYSSFIHYEIDFDDTDWQEKLKNAMCNALEELHNVETIWITVYAHTIPGHEEDDDFMDIKVTKDFARQYFEETQDKNYTRGNISKDHYDCFEDWNDDYICDDTMDFYEYAMKQNAILRMV